MSLLILVCIISPLSSQATKQKVMRRGLIEFEGFICLFCAEWNNLRSISPFLPCGCWGHQTWQKVGLPSEPFCRSRLSTPEQCPQWATEHGHWHHQFLKERIPVGIAFSFLKMNKQADNSNNKNWISTWPLVPSELKPELGLNSRSGQASSSALGSAPLASDVWKTSNSTTMLCWNHFYYKIPTYFPRAVLFPWLRCKHIPIYTVWTDGLVWLLRKNSLSLIV